MSQPATVLVLTATAMALASSCGSSKGKSCDQNAAGYYPRIDPADFSTIIDNKYLSYLPGTVSTYRQSAGEIVEQDVLSETKMVMGVKTVVVHDFLKSQSGQLLEDTFDYYAQDKAGNVWYLGEDTKAYVNDKVSTEGSWLAGDNCARPGIVFPANPQVGDKYRQEYLEGEAEDEAKVVSLSEKVTVAYGTFDNCIKTEETTRLAPGDVENKYYCAGVFGPLLSVDIGSIDPGKKEELVSINGKTSP